MKKTTLGAALLVSLGIWGCNDSETSPLASSDATAAERPAGWTEESHGKGATPNYDSVFRQDEVRLVVLELTDSAYSAMWSDMTSIAGTFGAGSSGTPGGVPNGQDTGRTAPPTGFDTTGHGGVPPDSGMARPDSGMAMPNDTSRGGLVNNAGMNDDALDMLSREPAYVPADLKMGGRTWWKIGLRLKGNSTLTQSWRSGSRKLPFRLDIDQFESLYPSIRNQRVWGFSKLTLNAGINDSSLLRERLASEVLRNAGVPTTRESFVKVLMKHGTQTDTLGLYTLVEIPDKPFLKAIFGSSGGNLYKPEGTGARFATMVDSTFLADADNISDVRAMFLALHASRSDTAAWRAGLETTFDVAGFLKWLSVNTLICGWDAYGQMAHNYYLYDNSGKMNWIPWDLSLSFQSSNQMASSVWLQSVDSTWPLVHFLLRDSKYRALYKADLEKALAGPFDASTISAKVESWKSLVRSSLTASELAHFDAATASIESFATARATQVRQELSGQ